MTADERREKGRKYRAKLRKQNPVKLNADKRAWHKKNKDEINRRRRERMTPEGREKNKNYLKRLRTNEEYRETANKRARERRANDPEWRKKQNKRNSDKYANDSVFRENCKEANRKRASMPGATERISATRKRHASVIIREDARARGCSLCRDNRAYLMQFHHVLPKGQSPCISNIMKTEILIIEMPKCVLLCSNCHDTFHFTSKISQDTIEKLPRCIPDPILVAKYLPAKTPPSLENNMPSTSHM